MVWQGRKELVAIGEGPISQIVYHSNIVKLLFAFLS